MGEIMDHSALDGVGYLDFGSCHIHNGTRKAIGCALGEHFVH
jgi:hypothetical protein